MIFLTINKLVTSKIRIQNKLLTRVKITIITIVFATYICKSQRNTVIPFFIKWIINWIDQDTSPEPIDRTSRITFHGAGSVNVGCIESNP